MVNGQWNIIREQSLLSASSPRNVIMQMRSKKIFPPLNMISQIFPTWFLKFIIVQMSTNIIFLVIKHYFIVSCIHWTSKNPGPYWQGLGLTFEKRGWMHNQWKRRKNDGKSSNVPWNVRSLHNNISNITHLVISQTTPAILVAMLECSMIFDI